MIAATEGRTSGAAGAGIRAEAATGCDAAVDAKAVRGAALRTAPRGRKARMRSNTMTRPLYSSGASASSARPCSAML